LPYFLALGVLGIGSAQFLYLFAISKINVTAAILLHYTGPVFVALYVVFVQRQKIGSISIIAIFGTLAGCYLVVGAYNLQLLELNRSGIISGLLAAVAFAIYSVLSEYGMRKYTPWTVLLYGMLFAALMWPAPATGSDAAQILADAMGLDFIYWYFRNHFALRALFRRHQKNTAHPCQYYRNTGTDIGRCDCKYFFG
jgi:drug/metabolite transporter (DMT)-like permease